MQILYKENEEGGWDEAKCEPDQVELMLDAGWQADKESAEEEQEEE